MTAQETSLSNFFETTLNGIVASGATSATLTAAPTSDGTSNIAAPYYLVIDPDSAANREVVLVTAASGTTLSTITRDVEGRHTTDPTHVDGTTVRMSVVKEMFDDTHDRINDIALTGDVTGTISSSTQDIATSIGSGVIVNDDVNASAAIAQSKLNLAITTSEVAAGTLVIESEGIASNDNDTTIPTSAAVKDYVDANTADIGLVIALG